MQFFGREQIFTDAAEITSENVVDVLNEALKTHLANSMEIEYLYNYYKGKTPILYKEKDVRPEINHRICENRANEIVSFKLGYGFGEPIQYIRRGEDKNLTDDINRLNEYMFAADKNSNDRELAEWMYICGLGYRMTLPNPDNDEETPFNVYSLDPRYSFVVKYNGLGEPPVMGVKYITRKDNTVVYSVYTKDWYYEISNCVILKQQPHTLGSIPIIEYPANTARLGAFEIVLPLLDAINEVQSNRLDDLVQYVNSFLALLGGSIDEETYEKLESYKMLCLPEGVDAKYLSSPLDQSDIQILAENLYDNVLTICGLPNRNGGSSTSDTGSAVIMRDGWEAAETQMQATELMFKKSERRFLKLVLRILKDMSNSEMDLSLSDIEIKFSRRNYEGILTKSQVLVSMLANPKIHPEIAFTSCGMFIDPESAYLQSKEWWEENERKAQEQASQNYNGQEAQADGSDGADGNEGNSVSQNEG